MFHNIGQRTDMVLVTMCQKDTLNFIFILNQICNIGNNQVNAEHIVFREHQACINQDHVVPVTKYRHIFTNFAQTTQRDNLDLMLKFTQKKYTSIFYFTFFRTNVEIEFDTVSAHILSTLLYTKYGLLTNSDTYFL